MGLGSAGVSATQYPVDIAPEGQFHRGKGPCRAAPGHKNLKEGQRPLLLPPLAPFSRPWGKGGEGRAALFPRAHAGDAAGEGGFG